MKYRLGEDFESLHANGTATITSVYGGMPLIRSRSNNLALQLNVDAKSFQDKVDTTSTVADKKAQVWMMGITGDRRDAFGGGGLTQYALTLTSGNIDIRNATVLATDQLTAHSNGHYEKLAFDAIRLQNITATTSLYAAINAQFASKNLDVSEKMELGGASGVRAYPEGEAYGDQGYVLNLEARRLLPKFSANMPGQMQLLGFVDTGTVTFNKTSWSIGPNHKTLSGAGIGIDWANNNDFMVKLYYAHKLGSAEAVSAPDKKGRFWLQGVKYF